MIVKITPKEKLPNGTISLLESLRKFSNNFLKGTLNLGFEVDFKIFTGYRNLGFVHNTGTDFSIYLRESFILENDSEQIASVFFHEFGHLIDFELQKKKETAYPREMTVSTLKSKLIDFSNHFRHEYYEYLSDDKELIARMFQFFFMDVITPATSLKRHGSTIDIMPHIEEMGDEKMLFHPYSTRICLRHLGLLKDESVRKMLIS